MVSTVDKPIVEARSGIDNIPKFLHRFDNEILSIYQRRPPSEVEDIADAVRESIESIVFKAFENHPVFHIPRDDVHKHVIGVGSFTEGTKVDDVDEFDFTIVYPYFSGYENVYIVPSKNGPYCKQASMLIKSDAFFEAFYNGPHDACLTEFLLYKNPLSDQLLSPKQIRHYFFSKITECLEQNPNFAVVKETGKLCTLHIKCNYFSGIIAYSFQQERPAMQLLMEWIGTCQGTSLYINIDLAPAIIYPCASLRLAVPDVLNAAAEDTGYCYLIPMSAMFDIAFQLSFVQTENNIMRSLKQANDTRLLCYKLFKFLSRDTHIVTSYVIKTYIIRDALITSKQTNLDADIAKFLIKLQGYIDSMKVDHTCNHAKFHSVWFQEHPIICIENTESTARSELDNLTIRFDRTIELLQSIEKCHCYDYSSNRDILLAVVNRK